MAFFKELVSLGFDMLISDFDVVWLSSHWQRWMSWDDPRPPLAEAAPLKMSYLWNGWEPPPTHRPLALMIVSVFTSFFFAKEDDNCSAGMVRAAQASPDHGFCGVRARAGDHSYLELR